LFSFLDGSVNTNFYPLDFILFYFILLLILSL